MKEKCVGFLDGCRVVEERPGCRDLLCVTARSKWEWGLVRRSIMHHMGTTMCIMSPEVGATVKKGFGKRVWQKILCSHRELGGLTGVEFVLGVLRKDRRPFSASDISFGSKQEDRDQLKFLEPSVRLGKWRNHKNEVNGPVWDGYADRSPIPWPVDDGLWICAPSVYLGKKIYRPMTNKEWAQAHDLRPEWGDKLRAALCSQPEGVIPMRFVIELALGGSGCRIGSSRFANLENNWVQKGEQAVALDMEIQGNGVELDQAKYFGWVWDSDDTDGIGSATTSDEAGVRYHLWAVGGDEPGMESARELLRSFLWKWWIRKMTNEIVGWLRDRSVSHPQEVSADRSGARDCLTRLANSTWFEWSDGSRIHFWRWPERWFKEARDGLPPMLIGPRPPRQLKWPAMKQDDSTTQKEAEKLIKVIRRRYIVRGPVTTVIPRICVPKGEDDIRVVWDLTKNKVNEGVHAPTFFLLGIHSLCHRIHEGQFVADFDCGEFFNNFTLHSDEERFMGVYLSPALRKALGEMGEPDVPQYLRWARLPFGWRPAPFLAVSMMMRSLELAKGHPGDQSSAFAFETVTLNLPGNQGYDPGMPRVLKYRRDGKSSCDVVAYVDDGRVLGPTKVLIDKAMRQVVCGVQARGTQDAARKREGSTLRPRAWTGGVVHTDKGLVRKFVVKKKWVKMKEFLEWISGCQEEDLDRKKMESGVGFLIHMVATYDFIRPYLIGFYMAMNQFREGRNAEGWRTLESSQEEDTKSDVEGWIDSSLMTEYERMDNDMNDLAAKEVSKCSEAPASVPKTELLLRNVKTLLRLTETDSPVQLLVYPIRGSDNVMYAGTDASGEGYGGRDEIVGDAGESNEFVFGYWGGATDESSSNWREMKIVLDKIRRDVSCGRLRGREVWFFTDNATLERAYHKGYSSSEALYIMVEELWALRLRGFFILRIVHIAGTRMIETGIDGLSRGEFELGLLRTSLRDSVPLGKSALERSPELLGWVRSWCDEDLKVATAKDWHYDAQQSDCLRSDDQPKTWVWDLAPAAALYALEELAMGRTKRLDLLRGVVIVPRLMTPEWYRRFCKVVDLHFEIPAGSIQAWPENMHEPLTIGLFFPSYRCEPWDWKSVEWMGRLGWTLSSVHKESDARGRDLLHSFWSGAIRIPAMPTRLATAVLDEDGSPLPNDEDDEFMIGRDGDNLVCPFECDVCSFFGLTCRLPNESEQQDKTLMILIRRAKLDAFWSRRSSTIARNRRLFKRHVDVSRLLGYDAYGGSRTVDPYADYGLRYALTILWESLSPGRFGPRVQFATVRHVRGMGTNVESMWQGLEPGPRVVRRGAKVHQERAICTDSVWMRCFMSGLQSRMGESLHQDMALTPLVVGLVLQMCEEDWNDVGDDDWEKKRIIAEEAVFFVLTYVGGLRGSEVRKVVVTSLRRQFVDARGNVPAYVGLPLVGRFKLRGGVRSNIIVFVVQTTSSGIRAGLWLNRLIICLEAQGIVSGWLYQNVEGNPRKSETFRNGFFERLERAKGRNESLFGEGVNIWEDYGPSRSGRRGANTQALKKCSKMEVELFFRWNTGGDETSHLPMHILYAEKKHLVSQVLKVSLAL